VEVDMLGFFKKKTDDIKTLENDVTFVTNKEADRVRILWINDSKTKFSLESTREEIWDSVYLASTYRGKAFVVVTLGDK
jgi:hypothetical protein